MPVVDNPVSGVEKFNSSVVKPKPVFLNLLCLTAAFLGIL